MKPEDFTNASDDFKRKNPTFFPDHPRENPQLECNLGLPALAADKNEACPTGLIHIRVVSVRKRLLDPDNLSPKWLIDCLRYCGAIRGDEPDKITLEVSQRKARQDEEEHTLVELFEAQTPTAK